jgi:transcription elongation factor Elf1
MHESFHCSKCNHELVLIVERDKNGDIKSGDWFYVCSNCDETYSVKYTTEGIEPDYKKQEF